MIELSLNIKTFEKIQLNIDIIKLWMQCLSFLEELLLS